MKLSFLALRIGVVLLGAAALASAPALVPGYDSSAVGPRGPVGPDVPLSAAEQAAWGQRVTVAGQTAAAVQAACNQAASSGVPVVFLPAGQYRFEATVNVPGGLTLLGEGSNTLCQTNNRSTSLFSVAGDHVRFTRLKLQGATTSWDSTNATNGILAVNGNQNVHIDHCELLGFRSGTWFDNQATGQVDHCSIHHCLVPGYGYGVNLLGGAYVMVCDNEFSQCRHMIVTNGTLNWSGPVEGMWVHLPGRLTHWEFLHNHANHDDLVPLGQGNETVNAHPGMDGTFIVQGNLLENSQQLCLYLNDGSGGLIDANEFSNVTTAIHINAELFDGYPVQNAMPRNISITGNTFLNVGQPYDIGQAVNIWIDGCVVPSTWTASTPPPPPPPAMPYLNEMGADGILTWTVH
jgi:pectate lyase-like protein